MAVDKRQIRRVWGVLTTLPVALKNKMMGFNEGDNGSGRDRTEMVASGPTGDEHVFKTWEETEDYVQSEIGAVTATIENAYVLVSTVNQLVSALEQADEVTIMITDYIDFSSNVTINVTENKAVYSLYDNYLSVTSGAIVEISTPTSGTRTAITIDFYCPVNNAQTSAGSFVGYFSLIDGDTNYDDFIKFGTVKRCNVSSSSLNFSSRAYYESAPLSTTAPTGDHVFWRGDSLLGDVSNESTELRTDKLSMIETADAWGSDWKILQVSGITTIASLDLGTSYTQYTVIANGCYASGNDISTWKSNSANVIATAKILTSIYEYIYMAAAHFPVGQTISPFTSNITFKSYGAIGLRGYFPSTGGTITGIYWAVGSIVDDDNGNMFQTINCNYNSGRFYIDQTGDYQAMKITPTGIDYYFENGTGGTSVIVSTLTPKFKINSDGVLAPNLKSGTTQAGAGAAASELWVDTDDDNTVKRGV